MFDFVPLNIYSKVFINAIFLTCIMTFVFTSAPEEDWKTANYSKYGSIILLLFSLLYIGFRPINGVFVDMMTYAQTFQQYRLGALHPGEGDVGFEYYIYFATKIMTVEFFFFFCAVIYIVSLFVACRNWFPKYYFFAFLLFLGSFSFWTYGTNGIRNGMATSLFVLGVSYLEKNKMLMCFFLLLAISFHQTIALPLLAFIVTFFVTDTKKYYLFWLLSIVLSLAMGSVWIALFESLGFGGDRLSGYLTNADSSKFSSTGFRFDFLLYGAAPLVMAYFYIYKNGFEDKMYKNLLHTYIVANSFWIMVIRANFSNRFAYLSWFLMAIIIIYPLLKQHVWNNQLKKIGIVSMAYFSFTYFMSYYYN